MVDRRVRLERRSVWAVTGLDQRSCWEGGGCYQERKREERAAEESWLKMCRGGEEAGGSTEGPGGANGEKREKGVG